MYMFAAMVLFGAAWTLKCNEHVRFTSSTLRERADPAPGSTYSAASSPVPMCLLMIRITCHGFRRGLTSTKARPTRAPAGWPVKLT